MSQIRQIRQNGEVIGRRLHTLNGNGHEAVLSVWKDSPTGIRISFTCYGDPLPLPDPLPLYMAQFLGRALTSLSKNGAE